MLPSLSDLRDIDFPHHADGVAGLTVFDSTHVPFPIARIFSVRANAETTRGRHAHRLCSQLMVCLDGRCEVTCKDGSSIRRILLERASHGLLIPPGIWAEQRYLDEGATLMVLCDRPYDESDYVRDYQDFLAFRANRSNA